MVVLLMEAAPGSRPPSREDPGPRLAGGRAQGVVRPVGGAPPGEGPRVSCDIECDVIPHGAVDGVW